MTEITAAKVKELRESTGAGMLDCKKALVEADGDMEKAVDWLRKKGLASAAKKASRVAAEGLVAVAVEGNKGAVVEVNSETDFVAKNEIFQESKIQYCDPALQNTGKISTAAGRFHRSPDLRELGALSFRRKRSRFSSYRLSEQAGKK